MNIVESFSEYFETISSSTLGQDLFIGGIPSSAPSTCFWLVAGGGSITDSYETGQRTKSYLVDVYYRSTDAEDVYNTMQDLEEAINSDGCTELTDFETIEMEAQLFPTDNDLDDEDRTIGFMQISIRVYK